MRKDIKKRNSLQYKIKMWFYHLTFNDVKKGLSFGISFLIEFIMCAIFLGLLIFAPALLH